YQITATAEDLAGNLSALSSPLTVTIDTVPPITPIFDLAPASDTGVLGDHATTQAVVTLAGQTSPGVAVVLDQTNASTIADGVGDFNFPAVALALGPNVLTAQATD